MKCKEPTCPREACAYGLCQSHYQSHVVRGKPLRPLRGPHGALPGPPSVTFGVRVAASTAAALDALPDGRSAEASKILDLLMSGRRKQKGRGGPAGHL